MKAIREEIGVRFHVNLSRMRSRVALNTSSPRKGLGRRPVQDSDLLRSAVVLLHAALEDLLRSLAEWKLPTARPEIFAEVPLAGTRGKIRFGLQDLAGFRGQSVGDIISQSIKEHLERSNFNHPGDIKAVLESIGLDPRIIDPVAAELAAMMSRRHWIAHRVDWHQDKERGRHQVKSLSNLTVTRWLVAVENFGQEVLLKA
jgi:hypothetical protein